MTHPDSTVEAALELHSEGRSAKEIANRLAIPSGTIRYWLAGRLPSPRSDCGCQSRRQTPHLFKELPPIYVYLLGLYLGDGSIATHPRGVFKLRIALDAAYPGIIEEAAAAMKHVVPGNAVNTCVHSGYVEVYSYSKSWPCLLPQHGPGTKHLRPITLTEWQRELVSKAPGLLLRGLIHSDGCRSINTGRGWSHPRYSFSNLSEDIRGIFIEACDTLGLRWTTSGRTVYVSRMVDVAAMDRFIGPKH